MVREATVGGAMAQEAMVGEAAMVARSTPHAFMGRDPITGITEFKPRSGGVFL